MSTFYLRLTKNDDCVGMISMDDLNADDEVVKRKVDRGLSLESLLAAQTGGKLSLGALSVNLDFDEDGRLINLEFYT